MSWGGLGAGKCQPAGRTSGKCCPSQSMLPSSQGRPLRSSIWPYAEIYRGAEMVSVVRWEAEVTTHSFLLHTPLLP